MQPELSYIQDRAKWTVDLGACVLFKHRWVPTESAAVPADSGVYIKCPCSEEVESTPRWDGLALRIFGISTTQVNKVVVNIRKSILSLLELDSIRTISSHSWICRLSFPQGSWFPLCYLTPVQTRFYISIRYSDIYKESIGIEDSCPRVWHRLIVKIVDAGSFVVRRRRRTEASPGGEMRWVVLNW